MVYSGLRGYGRSGGERCGLLVGMVEEKGTAVGELDVLIVELVA